MDIAKLQAENFEKFLADGPRLRYDYHVWVVAKDTEHKKVLLGGLGGCGVGEWWFDMEERYTEYSNYAEAPETTFTSFDIKTPANP